MTTKHLLPPLAGVFDRGDDRVLAARLVAALGRIFEECRLQFEAAERRGRARSPRNPLRAVDLRPPIRVLLTSVNISYFMFAGHDDAKAERDSPARKRRNPGLGRRRGVKT